MTQTTPAPALSQRRRVVIWSLGLLIVIGIVLQVTIRDAWQWPTAVVFYALPRPVIAILAALAALAARRLSRSEFRVALLAGSGCFLWTVAGDLRWNPQPLANAEPQWTIAVWNAAHLPRGVQAAAEVIRQWNADVVGVVEAGTTYELELVEWQKALPDYQIVCPRPQMLLLARGQIRKVQLTPIGRHSDVATAEIEREGHVASVALVDVISNLHYGRAEPLRNLTGVLNELPARPQVVMGDFNTPPESVWFESLREHYACAFDRAGRGLRTTWPVPAPVLQLDFLWTRKDVVVHQCFHRWTLASDHRPVIAHITIATTATE